MERSYDEDQLVEEIKATNPGFLECDVIKVAFKKQMKSYRNESDLKWLYILEADGDTYEKLVDKYIMVDFSHHYIKEYVNVVRCFNCQKYNHKASACTDAVKCGRCSGDHSTRDCAETGNFNCVNCEEAVARGAKMRTNHPCGSYRCQYQQNIVMSLKNQIQQSKW